jgi:hypothetical protein
MGLKNCSAETQMARKISAASTNTRTMSGFLPRIGLRQRLTVSGILHQIAA